MTPEVVETSERTEYELMYVIKQEVSYTYPNGRDTETAAVDGALGVIRYLLKNDSDVKDYKLVKRRRR